MLLDNLESRTYFNVVVEISQLLRLITHTRVISESKLFKRKLLRIASEANNVLRTSPNNKMHCRFEHKIQIIIHY